MFTFIMNVKGETHFHKNKMSIGLCSVDLSVVACGGVIVTIKL